MNWGCSGHLVFNIFLTSFVWLLGIGHAWVMIFASAVFACTENVMEFIREDAGCRRIEPANTVPDEIAVEVPGELEQPDHASPDDSETSLSPQN
ncbi:hypothetical protein ANCCAN_05969 [Ancylostoma caninum]|uniref:Uncharacterized protein n=1 Tax=Ancylostoma caninum TaxID=29170 RepID=A0A368GY55_ANCCA|nr:hypothetical protein ANCCAN_05969 [Ancylostoma caninum]